MDSELKFAVLVMGLPIAGLVYCGLGIAAMATNAVMRDHPIASGSIFVMIPLTIAVSLWISASAKAYRH